MIDEEVVVLNLLEDGPLDEVALLNRMEAEPVFTEFSGLSDLLWQMTETGLLEAVLPDGCRDSLTEPLIYSIARVRVNR